jgi:hypothetical protein
MEEKISKLESELLAEIQRTKLLQHLLICELNHSENLESLNRKGREMIAEQEKRIFALELQLSKKNLQVEKKVIHPTLFFVGKFIRKLFVTSGGLFYGIVSSYKKPYFMV